MSNVLKFCKALGKKKPRPSKRQKSLHRCQNPLCKQCPSCIQFLVKSGKPKESSQERQQQQAKQTQAQQIILHQQQQSLKPGQSQEQKKKNGLQARPSSQGAIKDEILSAGSALSSPITTPVKFVETVNQLAINQPPDGSGVIVLTRFIICLGTLILYPIAGIFIIVALFGVQVLLGVQLCRSGKDPYRQGLLLEINENFKKEQMQLIKEKQKQEQQVALEKSHKYHCHNLHHHHH